MKRTPRSSASSTKAKPAARIGLVGLGYWGKNILRSLSELKELSAACDMDTELLAQRKKEFPGERFTSSFQELLADKSIRGIVIATPAATHAHLALQALKAGKDVLVEKPLALDEKAAKEVVACAKACGRILMVGHILQYHPAVRTLKEIISRGELGKIHYIYSSRLNIGKLRVEENILWSFAPHDISMILSLLDREPERVQCTGGSYLTKGVYDVTLTTMEFSGGIKAHVFVSWLHPFKEQKLVVVGSQAMAVFDDTTQEKLFLYPHKIEWKQGLIPVAQKASYTCPPVAAQEPLKEELLHFISCIERRQQPLTDGREGLKVLRVLEQAEESLSIAGATPATEGGDGGYFAHPTACVDTGCEIGQGTRIWHYSHILKGTRIGKQCTIGQNASIGPEVTIGDNCKIQNNVSVYKGVTLESGVFCGPSCVFTNVYNPRAFIDRKDEFRPTLVKKGATIGANATIVCGATIGQYALIGAGAVVKGDVPDYALMVGVPARQIGWACVCGTTVSSSGRKDRFACPGCGKEYRVERSKLICEK